MAEETGKKSSQKLTTTEVVHRYLNEHRDFEKAMTIWRIEVERQRNTDDAVRASLTALTTYAGAAIRSAILVNGGAAVALLAFIAHVVGIFEDDHMAYSEGLRIGVVRSLGFYATGALSGGLSVLSALVSQWLFHRKAMLETDRPENVGDVFAWLGLVLVFIAFLCFGIGSYFAGESLLVLLEVK